MAAAAAACHLGPPQERELRNPIEPPPPLRVKLVNNVVKRSFMTKAMENEDGQRND